MKEITIGITDCAKYVNYEKWVLNRPGIKTIRLGHAGDNFNEIKKCHGIILSGGQDLHPVRYHKPEYMQYSSPEEIDEDRDEFEWRVLEYTLKNNLPLLGICRGLQVTNVFLGGSLIPDIPSFSDANHAKFSEGEDRYHSIRIAQSSSLFSITQTGMGEVNSAHHQGADKIGEGLVPNALSHGDHFVEGLENIDRNRSFLLLVQWHPERMKDQQNPFAGPIRDGFIKAIRNK